MTKDRYFELLGQTMGQFVDVAKELEAYEPTPATIAEWNDEFMLALYEATNDGRKV